MAIKIEGEAVVRVDGQEAGQQLNKLQQKVQELKKQMVDLKSQPLIDPRAQKDLEKEIKKTNAEIKTLQQSTFSVKKVMDDLSGSSLKDLNKAYRKLNLEVSLLNRNSAEYATKVKQMSQVKTEIDNTRKSMSAVGKEQGFWAKNVDGLKNAASGILPAFGWAAVATGAVMAAQKVFQLSQEVINARKQVQQLTGLSGKELANLTSEVKATADTFGKDFKETLVASNNFAKTMGISASEALNLIDKGFAAGADTGGEFLDMVKEYGAQFKAAGVSADQMIAILSTSVKEGIYSDKGADVVKEGMLRLREMPKATADALNAIGISSVEMQKKLTEGTITVFDAIQMVSKRLGELPPQSGKVGTAIADIFGGPGEDAGLEFIKLLGRVDKGMDAIVKKSGETAASQLKLKEANEKLNKAFDELIGNGTTFFDGINASVKLFVADGLIWAITEGKKLVAWFKELYDKSVLFRAELNGHIFVIKTLWNTFKLFFTFLYDGFKTTAELIKAVFTGEFGKIPGILREATQKNHQVIKDFGKDVAKDFSEGWNNTLNKEVETPVMLLNKTNADLTKLGEEGAKNYFDGFNKQVAKEYTGPIVTPGVEPTKKNTITPITNKDAKNPAYDAQIALIEQEKANKEEYLQWLEKTNKEQYDKEIELINQQKANDEESLKWEEDVLAKRKQLNDDYNLALKSQYELDVIELQNANNQKNLLLKNYYDSGIITEKEYKDKMLINEQTFNQKMSDIDQKYNDQKLQNTLTMFSELAGLLSKFKKTQKIAMLTQLAIDTASAISSLMKASEQNQLNGQTWGLAGVAQFAAGIIRIMGNVAKAKDALSEADQYYQGRYPVLGAKDHKTYNVPYRGQLKTGYLPQGAALFNEKGTEAVITAEHLKNPEVQVNYSRILDAINHKTPQHAEGRTVQTTVPTQNVTVQNDNETKALMAATYNLLADIRNEGVKGVWEYQQFKKGQDDHERVINKTSL